MSDECSHGTLGECWRKHGPGGPAPVSAVAGPEPDEGRCAEPFCRNTPDPAGSDDVLHNHGDRCRPAALVCTCGWYPDIEHIAPCSLAAPAAPVGDEGRRGFGCCAHCGCPAEGRNLGHVDECAEGCNVPRPPGDEGAARAAVARVLALRGNPRSAPSPHVSRSHRGWWDAGYNAAITDALAAALSAVSGEHRETGNVIARLEEDALNQVDTPRPNAFLGEHREAEDGQ